MGRRVYIPHFKTLKAMLSRIGVTMFGYRNYNRNNPASTVNKNDFVDSQSRLLV